ncbi:hypothetical protein BDZ85DRAFT_27288 [Elsinoe ampelina]|uniref:Uncharacterized protein n=1 Tax=Elsinoe ampelina TaxID=302913 RepID=A0A6A6G4H5_9PEZI|nr:hypothetical protein BDZ85DRAFT_27288 [Elsinoe ampelina]
MPLMLASDGQLLTRNARIHRQPSTSFFDLPPQVRSRIYQLILAVFDDLPRSLKTRTSFLHELPLFHVAAVIKFDQKLAFSAVRPHFEHSRRYVTSKRITDARHHFFPDYFDFLRQPLLGCPPIEFPHIRFSGLDGCTFVCFDIAAPIDGPPRTTYTPFLAGCEDLPLWQKLQAQLELVGWLPYREQALGRLCSCLSASIAARNGYGITTTELQILVDFSMKLAADMQDFAKLAAKMEKQAERRRHHRGKTTISSQPSVILTRGCNPQSLSFFDLPPEVRGHIYAALPLVSNSIDPQVDGRKAKSLHHFDPPSLLRIPFVRNKDRSNIFDAWRLVIYIHPVEHRFSIPLFENIFNFHRKLKPWSIRSLLGDDTVNWLKASPSALAIEFKHLQIRGPFNMSFDLDVLQDSSVVRIRDVHDFIPDHDRDGSRGTVLHAPCCREFNKRDALSRRLERSISGRVGTGLSLLEIIIMINEMRNWMICRRYGSVQADGTVACMDTR